VATILVVDDDANSRLLVATLLEPSGHVVFEASSGDDALAQARLRRFDLILTDLSMPGTSGAAFVRALRAGLENAATPIALHTASSASEPVRDFMRTHGIAHFIQKPTEPLAFIRAVENALLT
jgi:CheY-like chemotaxis protein